MKKRNILLTLAIAFLLVLVVAPANSEAYDETHVVHSSGLFTVNLQWECNTGVTGSFSSNATIYAYIEKISTGIPPDIWIIWNVTATTGNFDVDFEEGYLYRLNFDNDGPDPINVDYTVDCKLQIPGFELVFLLIAVISLIYVYLLKNNSKK